MTAPVEPALTVVALGGHGISPPSADGYDAERERIGQLRGAFSDLVGQGRRLLIVHGNGPQVGRLLAGADAVADLDIHTAQTQGELGYLIAQALPAPNAALITRVVVDGELGPSIKPIGPVSAEPFGDEPCVHTPNGWRLLVPSPKPTAVVELELIRSMLQSHHVVAGGGGGVPLTAGGEPREAVIDKDWVASMLAIALDAQMLVFATDVEHVYAEFGATRARPLPALDVAAGRELLASGELDAGSMAPKLASAVDFAETTGRRACICSVAALREAVAGTAGTQIE